MGSGDTSPPSHAEDRGFDDFYRPPRIYPLTANLAGDHTALARELLAAGAEWLQFRDKSVLPDRELFHQITEIVALARVAKARLIVNDRVDLALATGAAGVHLGQQDLPVSQARFILGQSRVIGLSTHNLEQFQRACELDLNYLAVGPIFSSSTKLSAYPPLGLKLLEKVRPLTAMPIVAIGGITPARARKVWKLGIDSVAVVSDIVQHESPGIRLREYLELAKEMN